MEKEKQLRRLATEYARSEITDEEWRSARECAAAKLKFIIARYGTLGGERESPYYLAQLIAEAVRAKRFSTLTQLSYQLNEARRDLRAGTRRSPESASL